MPCAFSLAATELAHAQLGQHLRDGGERAAHLFAIQSADAADPEAVGNRELTGIDHITPLLELVIEALEHELGMLRHMECDNNRSLQIRWQQRPEAQGPHTL